MAERKVRTPSKTPRTLIGEFMDSSRTHTQKVVRDRVQGLVRTPEIPSARKALQHDRVASLRGKKMSSSFSFGSEETPRQILEGFLADEHSTAPLVRVQKRTSQSGMSSSQPVLPVTKGWSHVASPANLTAELERDTPRTLMQKYLMNTSPSVETPVVVVVRKDTADSLRSTPVVPLVNDTYNTPSPFRDSSGGSADVMQGTSRRSKTPRSRKGRFNLSTHDLGSSLVIPATNPNDYVVPSPFRSSSSEDSEEEVIAGTQPSRRAHYRRSFNLAVPEHVLDQLKQGKERTYQQAFEVESSPGDMHYDDSDISDEQFSRNSYQAEPLQSHEMEDNNMEVEAELGDIHSVSSEEDGRRFSILPREGLYREYTLPLKGGQEGTEVLENISHVSGSSARSLSVVYTGDRQYVEQQSGTVLHPHEDGSSQIGIASGNLGYSPESGQYLQAEDPFRYGRFSDGHQNRLVAMGRGDAGTRRSEGNVREDLSMFSFQKGNVSMDRQTGERNMSRSVNMDRHTGERNMSSSEIMDRHMGAGNVSMSSSDGRSEPSLQTANRSSESLMLSERKDPSMIGRSSNAADRERLYLGVEVTCTPLRGQSERTLLGHEKMPESTHVSQSGLRSLHTPAQEAEEENEVDENSPFSAVTPSPVVSTRGNSPAYVTSSPSQRSPARSYERSSNTRSGGSVASLSARSETSFRTPGKRTPLQSMHPANTGDVNNISQQSSVLANNSSLKSSSSSLRGQRSTPSTAGSGPQTPGERGTPKSTMSAAASNLRYRNATPGSPGSVQQTPAQRGTPKSTMSAAASNLRSRNATLGSPGSVQQTTAQRDTTKSATSTAASRLISRNDSPRTSQASPVVAKRKHGTVDQLPQHTMMFSPQIVSTQNIATLARTSSSPSKSQPHVEQDNLSDEEVATPEQSSPSRPVNAAASVDKSHPSAKKKAVRKPREKSRYLIPVSTVKKQFTHYAGMRVSKEAIEEVMKISETYWDNLCADLEAYAKHAGRKKITMADFELLFRRQVSKIFV
ncbi:hypothetical protein DPMN_171250 [Dreissena polymorpha]|uniref:CENP-T/Histone H4 histone fold domain-containing protein n=1 Tax=Dreissena polymorpha TaxID=45954 RepID=A0A9D4IC89_DREPO|nr:hypothetical protein DPMN_171250 [Dreissena polymorpha]